MVAHANKTERSGEHSKVILYAVNGPWEARKCEGAPKI